MMSKITRTERVKFRIKAGIIARIGTMRLTIYRLFGQNSPLARFEKDFTLPSLATLRDTRFNPEIHREFGRLKYTQFGHTLSGICTYISIKENAR